MLPVEFDLGRAFDRLGGDRELLARVVGFVCDDSPRFLLQIDGFLEARQLDEVERMAHSLRGLVSNVNCLAIEEKTREIESLARDNNAPAIEQALPPLKNLIENLIERLGPALCGFEAA